MALMPVALSSTILGKDIISDFFLSSASPGQRL